MWQRRQRRWRSRRQRWVPVVNILRPRRLCHSVLGGELGHAVVIIVAIVVIVIAEALRGRQEVVVSSLPTLGGCCLG